MVLNLAGDTIVLDPLALKTILFWFDCVLLTMLITDG